MDDKIVEVGSVFGGDDTATIEKTKEVIKDDPKPDSEPEPDKKPELDEDGKPIEQKPELDENGDPVKKEDEPKLDENGKPIETDELLPEFQYGDEVYKAEDIAELIELKKSDAYEILKDEKLFDRAKNELTIYRETRKSEVIAKDLNSEAKEVRQIFDEAVVRFDKEIDLGEDIDPEIAKEVKELYAGYEAREVQVKNATQAAEAYANLTTMEVVVREVPEFKNITTADILAAFKDPNHENRAEAVLLNDMMKKSTTRSAYNVVDDLNFYFGKSRKSEKELAEDIARKNNKKVATFGFTNKTTTATSPKKVAKKPAVNDDGIVYVDSINEKQQKPNPYLASAPQK